MEEKEKKPKIPHLAPYQVKPGERRDTTPKRPPARGGLARSTRNLIGEDGFPLVKLWWSIANDPMRRDSDRLEASRLLAERGWGKAAAYVAQEGDPLGLENAERAAEEFRRKVIQLAARGDEGSAPAGGADPVEP
jgi:hypothetical protein